MIKDLNKEERQLLLEKLIDKLLNKSLTKWEQNFLKSVKKQIKQKNLTEKQISVLENLKKKYIEN